jgi:hypothetical protein
MVRFFGCFTFSRNNPKKKLLFFFDFSRGGERKMTCSSLFFICVLLSAYKRLTNDRFPFWLCKVRRSKEVEIEKERKKYT